MNKKIIISILAVILVGIVLISINNNTNKSENEAMENKNIITNIEPLSKENAIKILKAEYGDFIDIKEDDIKIEGNEYIIDVYVLIADEENHEDLGEHEHEQSLGIHKIDIHTGELIFPEVDEDNE